MDWSAQQAKFGALNQGGAREISTWDRINAANDASKAGKSSKSRSGWLKWLPTALAAGATVAAAPFTGGTSLLGTAAILGGSAAAGAGLGELGAQMGNEEKLNLGNVGKEAAISGVTGAIPIGGAAKAARIASKEAAEQVAKEGAETVATNSGRGLLSKIRRSGTGLRQDVVNPKVTASVSGAQKEAEIASRVSKVKGLSAKGKYGNLQEEMEGLSAQIKPILTGSKKTVGSDDLLATIRTKADESGHFLAGDPLYEKQLGSVLTDISKKTGGAKVLSPTQMYDYKSGMDMNSVFTKLQKGADLNPKEAARLAVWSSFDDKIASTVKEVKDLTKQQSLLIQGAPGLKANAEKTLGIPLLGIKSKKAEQGLQAGRELAGRMIERGTPAMGGVPLGGNGLIAKIAREGTKQTIGGVAGDAVIGEEPGLPMDGEIFDNETPFLPDGISGALDPVTGLPIDDAASLGDLGELAGTDETSDVRQQLKQYALQALADGDSKGLENITKVAALLESFGETEKPVKKTEGQRARDNAARLTDKAMAQLEAGSVNTGLVSGRLEKIKGILGRGDPESLAFNTTVSNLMALIAKANAGTSFTDGEKALLKQYSPSVGDSGQVLRAKLAALKDVFGQAQEAEYGTEYQPDVMVGAVQ